MANEISLSRGIRSNLLTLQRNADLMDMTQTRLATGKRVNSALDNPSNFFTATAMNSRAGDLSALLDAISIGVKTLEAADNGIKAITRLVESAKSTANQALATTDAAQRTAFAAQFDALRTQIDQLAGDANFNGKNLLSGSQTLTVTFNESGTTSIAITGVNFTATGLTVAASANNWAADADINTSLGQINAALTTLRTQASSFGSNLQVVQNRQDFTKNLINTLKAGADNLVLADQNEEGANLLALQTRQQLSTTALSMASQQDQSVLRLFQ